MISCMFVSICNLFHARRANSGKLTTFWEIPLFDALVRRIEPRRLVLGLLKSTFNAENLMCRFFGLSITISAQFIF